MAFLSASFYERGAWPLCALAQDFVHAPADACAPAHLARRILNLTEVREAREILREMVIGALKELASLPMKVIDPNWLDTLEGNGSPSATVEASGSGKGKG